MKLLIVTDCYEPTINGVVTTIKNLKIQAELAGFEILIIEPTQFPNCNFKYYPDVKISFPLGLWRAIDNFNPDYIHIATEGTLGISAALYCRLHKRVYTTAFHTKWAEFMYAMFKMPSIITKTWLRWFHRGKVVFCTGNNMLEYLSENRIGARHIIWSRGVDTDIFNGPRFKRNKGKPRLINVGRVSKEKNLDEFCQLNPNKYDLTVVGDGPYLPTLKSKYPHVRFTGALIGSALADQYRKHDCFVFTSINDTFGMVIIESQIMGTPVAAHNVTGPKDIIVENVNGCIANDIEQAVDRALQIDRKNCHKYTVENYSWHSVWETFRLSIVKE